MYKPRTQVRLSVPRFGSRLDFIDIEPRVIEAKWTKNNHLTADELTITIGWKEGGVDPRAIKNARCGFWLWDANREDFDAARHLRFTGVCKKASRRIHESGWVVDLTFHDYTTLFIGNKPLKTSGMPQWSDTLQQIWERICDNTGWQDPDNGKILSSVEALKPNLHITRPDIAARKLGEIVPDRFHAISKPQPKDRASSWDVWQWCCNAIGAMSYIDKDVCVVTDTTGHYSTLNPVRAIYGENIHTFEEDVDTDITSKGILLKSMDQSTGKLLEAFYPPPGDERLKTKRSAFGVKSEGGASVTANEVSADYEEYQRFDIQTQTALDRCAREAYEERSRQEMAGSFRTSEMALPAFDDVGVADIFDLRAGDALSVELSPGTRDALNMIWSHTERVRYLVDNLDYDEDLADLIAGNINVEELKPTFHIKSIEVDIGPERFDVEIHYHNLILVGT